MSRITVVERDTASPEQTALLDAIQSNLSMVPNFLKVLANSPVALEAFLGLHKVAGEGELNPQTRERIALTVAQENSCQYCVSAHTSIGRKAGLDNAEIQAARTATSRDAKEAVALKFASNLVEHRGQVSTAELLELTDAGYSEAEIVEIITHVGMNILTNFIGVVSQVEIDFPEVELKLVS